MKIPPFNSLVWSLLRLVPIIITRWIVGWVWASSMPRTTIAHAQQLRMHSSYTCMPFCTWCQSWHGVFWTSHSRHDSLCWIVWAVHLALSLIHHFFNHSSLCSAVSSSESQHALSLSRLHWSLLSLSSTANSEVSREETRWSFTELIKTTR